MKYLLMIVLLFSTLCHAEYARNPAIDKTTWNALKPYFLPSDHPIKPKLDKLFSKRVSSDLQTLAIAGFKMPAELREDRRKVLVLTHSKLKGYMIKLYDDSNAEVVHEWRDFEKRIVGAQVIQELIDRCDYNHLFKVPKKWLYPLPLEPISKGKHPKVFVLVVEDMKIFSWEKNRQWWISVAMTKELANGIYTMLQLGGLSDSVYADNMSFSKDRRIAFVDTQHYHKWPVIFANLLPFFSPKMQKYWIELIHNGGPK